jgi:hypothetical protein
MKSYLTLLSTVFFSITTLFGQIIKHEDLSALAGSKVKAQTYVASTGVRFSLGDNLYFTNYEQSAGRAPFLLENLGNKPVLYSKLDAFDLKIYKIKLKETNEGNAVSLIVFDENTMLKFKLDVESALEVEQIKLGKIESEGISQSNATRRLVALQGKDSVFQEVIPSSSVVSTQKQDDKEAISKEMLLQSALEMKKFTRGYNTSLVLMTSGVIVSEVIAPNSSSSDANIIRILGGVLFLGGTIQGISARQHIGKSGAYLEAYANGVRIRF